MRSNMKTSHWQWQIKEENYGNNLKNHWVIQFERDFGNSSIPTSCSKQRQLWGQIRFLRVLSTWVLNMFKTMFEKQWIPVTETYFFMTSILLRAVISRCSKSYPLAVHVVQVGSSSALEVTGTYIVLNPQLPSCPKFILQYLGFWHFEILIRK